MHTFTLWVSLVALYGGVVCFSPQCMVSHLSWLLSLRYFMISTCVCVCVSVSGTACSSLQLVLSERYSSLSLYNGWDYNDFVTLAHIPIRLVDNFHTLASALSHGAGQVNRETTLVNLLAAVRSVSGCGRCEWVW